MCRPEISVLAIVRWVIYLVNTSASPTVTNRARSPENILAIAGANIASFRRVADAMLAFGVI